MNQYLSSKSGKALNKRADRLRNLIASDADAMGQLYDARVCNNISIELYNLRKRSGLTQKELAEKLNVKQSNISRWEKPGYQGYKVKMLSRLCRMLGGQLFVGIQPLLNVQYFRETFELHQETSTFAFRSDGTWSRTDNKLEVRYEGVSVNASV